MNNETNPHWYDSDLKGVPNFCGAEQTAQPPLRSVKQMVLDQLKHMLENQQYQKQRPGTTVDDKLLINQAIWTLEDVVAYVHTLPEQ